MKRFVHRKLYIYWNDCISLYWVLSFWFHWNCNGYPIYHNRRISWGRGSFHWQLIRGLPPAQTNFIYQPGAWHSLWSMVFIENSHGGNSRTHFGELEFWWDLFVMPVLLPHLCLLDCRAIWGSSKTIPWLFLYHENWYCWSVLPVTWASPYLMLRQLVGHKDKKTNRYYQSHVSLYKPSLYVMLK